MKILSAISIEMTPNDFLNKRKIGKYNIMCKVPEVGTCLVLLGKLKVLLEEDGERVN